MMKFEWKPRYHDEAGFWYCEKMIWMCVPETFGEFDNESDAEAMARYLNKRDNVDKSVEKKT